MFSGPEIILCDWQDVKVHFLPIPVLTDTTGANTRYKDGLRYKYLFFGHNYLVESSDKDQKETQLQPQKELAQEYVKRWPLCKVLSK